MASTTGGNPVGTNTILGPIYYIMNADGSIRSTDDPMEWALNFETTDRHVGRDDVEVNGENIKISTVFLGLDHNFSGGPPVLFETMVFGGEFDEACQRYVTIEEARKGHARWVRKVTSGGCSAVVPKLPKRQLEL